MAAAFLSAVPRSRLSRLSRCVNLSRWFRYPATPTPQHFYDFITDADLDLIQRLGVTGVRLTIGAEQIMDPDRPDVPTESTVEALRNAICRMNDRGLAVVIAIYGASDRVESPLRLCAFGRFWAALAMALSTTDPDAVLFEPVNEPIFTLLPRRWRSIERRLATAIRAAAPHHTLISSGTGWSSIDGLLAHEPLDDPNVVYTFHFYEPHLFTHQGAPWNSGWVTQLRNVPYPLTPDTVTAAFDRTSPHFASLLQQAACCVDARYIDARVRLAADWGRRHGVPLWVGEFGAYPPHAQRACVLQWFHDVRTAFERHGIGWAVWSYDEELALNRRLVDGRPVIDWDVARALGFPERDASLL